MDNKPAVKQEEKYVFLPRPEAHAMRWGELLSPLRHAVRDLLLLIDGAITQVDKGLKDPNIGEGGYVTGNCFLVYGERGTGKSTVLLTAQRALQQEDGGFFSPDSYVEIPEEEKAKELEFLEDAKKSASSLKKRGTIWLDPLDLESLPVHSNMLTTMLTWVLHALDTRGSVHNPLRRPSVIEEDADNARHKLTRLVKDATLMWEDIREHDLRNRAQHQMAAADIYTKFRDDFKDAIETLALELGRGSGVTKECHPIILPIDNIDRSTDHLYNIFKLAQMVASPYLWLVLAGDREDVEAFLERAYWKELMTVGEGAGAGSVGLVKHGIGKEDEALVMARRQAAAASHKLLPPSHRIKVELVRPSETLRFKRPRQEFTIQELLACIKVPNAGTDKKLTMLSMLDADQGAEVDRNSAQVELTHPAKLALQLPARGVLDLWQEAYRMLKDNSRFRGGKPDDDFRAEEIARIMLCNSISESRIPNEMGLYLQDKILYRDVDGSTTLKFCDPNPRLSIQRSREPEQQRRLYPIQVPDQSTTPGFVIRSTLSTMRTAEVLMLLLNPPKGARGIPLELPPLVAGWLLILHDIVLEGEKSWVLLSPISASDVALVSVQRQIVKLSQQGEWNPGSDSEVWWLAPKWESFLAQDVLWYRWRKFCELLQKTSSLRKSQDRQKGSVEERQKIRTDYLAWVMAIGWVACVIDTFWALTGSKLRLTRLTGMNRLFEKAGSALNGVNPEDIRRYNETVSKMENDILIKACKVYAAIMTKGGCDERCFAKRGARDDVFIRQQAMILMRDWLEQELPLLFSHLYVPLRRKPAEVRQANLKAFVRGETNEQKLASEKEQLEGRMLPEAWKSNLPFIFAEYSARVGNLFPKDATTPAPDKPFSAKGPFANLYEIFEARELT